jgi:membrane protease YdiL (CAAX protease family)
LAVYLVCLILGSAPVEFAIIHSGSTIDAQPLLVVLLMWTPALASISARLALRQGFGDVSFQLGGFRGLKFIFLGWLFPVGVGATAYGAAWLSGLATIAAPQLDYFGSVGTLPVKFALSLVLGLTLVTLSGMLTAAGEEIGWRGYMLTRLVDARLPRPVLLSGLVWAGWHLPLVVSGQYAAGPWPILSAVLFVLVAVPFAYLLAYLRLESGSLWPAIVSHAAWNAVIGSTFSAFTFGTLAGLWTGESGILTVLVTMFGVALLVRGTWKMRKAPNQAPFAEFRVTAL